MKLNSPKSVILTDSHAHIYAEQFKEDRDAALERAFLAGVTTIVMPNIDHTSIDIMLETEARNPQQCHSMMGLHPTSVGSQSEAVLPANWRPQSPPFRASPRRTAVDNVINHLFHGRTWARRTQGVGDTMTRRDGVCMVSALAAPRPPPA